MPLSKKEILKLLQKKSYDRIAELSLSDKRTISILISLSYDKNDPISWRAMEAIGLAAKEISKSDPATVRNIVGRLLWMIRDESGGIGWSVPEILGEIVRNNPVLCADIAPIIASSHEEKMLASGVLRALGRIGRIDIETINYTVPILISYLHSEDSTLRGHAAWALGEMGDEESAVKLEDLKRDASRINFYKDGELKEISVGELAAEAFDRLLGR